jgi:hypothetical protein
VRSTLRAVPATVPDPFLNRQGSHRTGTFDLSWGIPAPATAMDVERSPWFAVANRSRFGQLCLPCEGTTHSLAPTREQLIRPRVGDQFARAISPKITDLRAECEENFAYLQGIFSAPNPKTHEGVLRFERSITYCEKGMDAPARVPKWKGMSQRMRDGRCTS